MVGQFRSLPLQFGTFAEICVVQAEPELGALATIPAGMPSHVAAALPTAGMTALGAIEHTQVPEGGTLLIIGATGGVGTFAVQAAAARGIRTIATASAQHAEQVVGGMTAPAMAPRVPPRSHRDDEAAKS